MPDTQSCGNCARLQAENAWLKGELFKAQQIIKYLQAKLFTIYQYAEGIKCESNKVLSQKSGIPRSQWSYCKGSNTVAEDVSKLAQ